MGARDPRITIYPPNRIINAGVSQRAGLLRADPISIARQMAQEYSFGRPQIDLNAPFQGIAYVIASYPAGGERAPASLAGRFRDVPWLVAYIPGIDYALTNPFDPEIISNPNEFALALLTSFEEGVILTPHDMSPNAYQPQQGEVVHVSLESALARTGRYSRAEDNSAQNPSRVNPEILELPNCRPSIASIVPASDAEPTRPATPSSPRPVPRDEVDGQSGAIWLARMINIESPGGSRQEQLAIMKIAYNRMQMARARTRYAGQTTIERVVWGSHTGDEWFGPGHGHDVPSERPSDRIISLAEEFMADPGIAPSVITPSYHHMVHPRWWHPTYGDRPECIECPDGATPPEGAACLGDIVRRWVCARTTYPQLQSDGSTRLYTAQSAYSRNRDEPVPLAWMPVWTVLGPGGQADNPPIYIARALVS